MILITSNSNQNHFWTQYFSNNGCSNWYHFCVTMRYVDSTNKIIGMPKASQMLDYDDKIFKGKLQKTWWRINIGFSLVYKLDGFSNYLGWTYISTISSLVLQYICWRYFEALLKSNQETMELYGYMCCVGNSHLDKTNLVVGVDIIKYRGNNSVCRTSCSL